MKINKDHLIFSTGKTVYANCGIVGLADGEEGLYVTEGYDGGIYIENFTKGEKTELADYMIDLWSRFKKEIN